MLTEGTVPAAAQDGLGTETGAELGGGVVSCSALPRVGFTGHLDTLQELGPVLPSSLLVLNLQHFLGFSVFVGHSHGTFYVYLLEKHPFPVLVPVPVRTSSPLAFLVSWTLTAPPLPG